MLKLWFRIAGYVLVVMASFSSASGFAQTEVAVQRAINLDDERTIRRWLAAGGDPNRLDERGQTPLVLALRDGSFNVAAALLESPALRVDAINHAGETALMMASLKGQLAWVQRLVAAGAAINRDGWTPLHYAASGEGVTVVRWLLEQGARIDAPAPNRSTPLMMAARYGASESVDVLLSLGADTRLRNDRGMTAADFARGAGRDRLADRLDALARADAGPPTTRP